MGNLESLDKLCARLAEEVLRNATSNNMTASDNLQPWDTVAQHQALQAAPPTVTTTSEYPFLQEEEVQSTSQWVVITGVIPLQRKGCEVFEYSNEEIQILC